MSLTLDRPETDRMARELAQLTGETVEEVVAGALRARLEHERRQRDREELLARVRHIVRASGPAADPGMGDPAAFLYDDRGMPA